MLEEDDGPAPPAPPAPEPPNPVVNAAPMDDDVTLPAPVLDTSGGEILLLFGWKDSPLKSSRGLAEFSQKMK